AQIWGEQRRHEQRRLHLPVADHLPGLAIDLAAQEAGDRSALARRQRAVELLARRVHLVRQEILPRQLDEQPALGAHRAIPLRETPTPPPTASSASAALAMATGRRWRRTKRPSSCPSV